MSEERSRILNMLAGGKITAEEAERLLDALDSRAGRDGGGPVIKGDPTPDRGPSEEPVRQGPRHQRRQRRRQDAARARALGAQADVAHPAVAMDKINDSMSEQGISVDFYNFKPDDIDEFVGALRDMEINVDAKNGDTVRV